MNHLLCADEIVSLDTSIDLNRAITITAVGKTNPLTPNAPLIYDPRTVKNGEINLETISEQLAAATCVTEADCYAVVIGLVNTISSELEKGNMVRINHFGTLQISVKGGSSSTPEGVLPSNVTGASIIFRPAKKLKQMILRLQFIKK